MGVVILVLLVWLVAVAGCVIMKRIQPGNMLYPIYAYSVCLVLTGFVAWYAF